MERVLRSPEPAALSMEGPVLYFPIRHHSPVCAWHLEKTIEAYKPDCILVEGPENANELLEVLTDPETKAPVAFYYACRDEGKHLSDEEEPTTWRCWYPFLDTSPELVALREARNRGIPARFMDLSFGQILLATRDARGLRSNEEKLSYASDRYLSHSRFQTRLCEKAGVRDFEEFWEKYFETEGLSLTTEAFLNLMNTHCRLIREDTPLVELQEDGCLAREAHMAMRIRETSKEYRRVLVVAGGFHIPGLLAASGEPVMQIKAPKLKQTVYPMRYSMTAADALNGYASGIPMPGFYDAVWRQLHEVGPDSAYETVILDHLVRTGRKLRRKGENISAFDEMCAYRQAMGLADLREKRHPGLYELQDGVLGSFVKGEASLSGLAPMRLLREMTTGSTVGSLAANAAVPPLTRDFEEQCRCHRLKLDASRRLECTLSILSEPKHRDASRFLHQNVFLETGFAKRLKGPDLLQNRDRNLIRETWEYRWTERVESSLIENAVSGATVRDACVNLLRSRILEADRAEVGAELMTHAFLMGISDHREILSNRMDALLIADGDFTSLCRSCAGLYRLEQWKTGYGEETGLDLERLLARAFDRVVQLLPSMHSVDERETEQVQESMMLLYRLTLRPGMEERRERLRAALEALSEQLPIRSGVHGAALGLLYGMEPSYKNIIDRVTRGYLHGSKAVRMESASFLQGLFRTARDLLLTDPEFLREIDGLFTELEDEDFTAMLPQLRLAFSYFLPTETDRLARSAAKLHGWQGSIHKYQAVDAADYSRAEAVDAWAAAHLTDWGDEYGDL